MKAVVGLFDGQDRVHAVAARLRGAGFSEGQISVIDSLPQMTGYLNCFRRGRIWAETWAGTLLGAAIFLVFGILAGIGAALVTQASALWAIGAVAVFLLIGAGCGLFLGWVMGSSHAEGQIQELREKASAGQIALVAVQADKNRAKRATDILRKERAQLVRTCQAPEKAPARGQASAKV
jgi:hypothetical protein